MLTTILFSACVLVHGHDESLGAINPGQGGLNQGCRTGVSEVYECDSGLTCKKTNHGSYWTGECVQETSDRGGLGQRCRNGSNPCDANLTPVTNWISDPTEEALEVPRCRCQRELYDDSNEDSSDDLGSSGPMLGHRAPHTGNLGEPCDGNACNSGLHCKITWHGSYSTGTCVHDKQQIGGEGERCRTVQEGSPCNHGLQCEKTRMYPSGWTNICRRAEPQHHSGQEGQLCRTGYPQWSSACDHGLKCQRVQLLPSGHRDICQRISAHNEGEANQPCNDAPLAPCNHNNLRPHYHFQGKYCVCLLNLQSSGPDSDNGIPPAPRETDNLGQGLGEFPWDNDSNPKLGMTAPHMGNWGEPCRNTWPECNYGLECSTYSDGSATFGTCRNTPSPPTTPHLGREGQPCRNTFPQCNSGLRCSSWSDGSASYGMCTRQGPAPSPHPAPSPYPSNCGGVGQTCCGNSSCQGNLRPVTNWENLYGQALQRPVCRCEQMLGASPSGGDQSNEDSSETDSSTDELGLPAPKTGGDGEPCGNGCNFGLYCRKYQQGGATMGKCHKLPEGHGGEGERCFAAPLSPCNKGLKAIKKDGHCTCEYWLGESNDEPKLGLPAPDLGSLGNGCRNGSDGRAPCNYGLECSEWTEGTATFGTCILSTPTPPRSCGKAGERCCRSGPDCEYGNEAQWEHLRGQALEVCRCEPLLYGAAPSGGN